MKGQRSAAYPSYTIDYCLNLCESIYKTYGTGHRASREELAESLNLSVGNLTMKISSCVQYGLIDLKSKEGYKVSELFVRYYRPINDLQREESKIEAFKSPTLYQQIISAFSGNVLPTVKPLSNILLQKYNISESACEQAATIFIDNANELGLINEENELIMDAPTKPKESEGIIEEVPVEEAIIEKPIQKPNQPYLAEEQNRDNQGFQNNGFSPSNGVVINILLKEKRTAQLILPNDARAGDLETIINWIRLMKESFE